MAYEEEQGYDPEASVAEAPQAQEQGVDAGDSAAADMPLPDDAASKPAVRNWVRQLLDYTRSAFGINEEAVPTGSPAGQPQQAGEYDESTPNPASGSPTGLPQGEGEPDEAATGSPAGLPPVWQARDQNRPAIGAIGLPESTEHESAGALPQQAGGQGAEQTLPPDFNDPMSGASMPQVQGGPRPPAQLTPESGLGSIIGAAAQKGIGRLGEAMAPSEAERQMMSTPQEGPIKKMLREYVMGAGAEPAAQTAQRIAQVATEMPGATKSQIADEALKRAAAQGPEVGKGALQEYRQLQTSYRGKAAAALDHNDMDSATKLWNEGHTYVPDGTHVVAVPTPKGVTMVMNNEDGSTIPPVNLTKDQFRELLHKRAGEFDHLTEGGGFANTVKQLAQTPGMPAPQAAAGVAPQAPLGPMTRGVGTINGGEGDRNLSPYTGKGSKFGSSMSPAQRAQTGFGDVQPSDSQGRSKEAQAAQGLRPQTADMARPPLGRPAAGDMSPEARATRMTQWASQNRPGQRERLTEALRRGDTREETARVAAENKNDIARQGLGLKATDIERKANYGTENLAIKREAIAQRDRHLGYLVDKSTGDLNERALSRMGRADATLVRAMNTKLIQGGTMDAQDQADLARIRQRATEPPAATPPSARGAPSGGQQGEWRTNSKTGKQKWFGPGE